LIPGIGEAFRRKRSAFPIICCGVVKPQIGIQTSPPITLKIGILKKVPLLIERYTEKSHLVATQFEIWEETALLSPSVNPSPEGRRWPEGPDEGYRDIRSVSLTRPPIS
jgi:hypothetical protein